jgi:hypothetical protein
MVQHWEDLLEQRVSKESNYNIGAKKDPKSFS